MPSNPVAKVRFTDFSEPPERPGLRTRSLKRKKVVAPSGTSYSFRQQGRPTNPNSQWLPIRVKADVSWFEKRDGFQIKCER